MKRLVVGFFLLFSFYFSLAQKKPLDHSVYDSWQHIGERLISHDGKWVVYTIDPQEGDNELVIQSSDAKYKKTVPRGYSALITEDSRYLVFKIKPHYKDTREARIKKKKPDDMPKDSLAILELGKEEVWKKALVKNYKSPQRSYGWIAYQLEKQPEPAVKARATEPKPNTRVADSLNRIIDSLHRVIESMPEKKKKKTKDEDATDVLTNDSGLTTPDSYDADGDDATTTPAEPANDLVVKELGSGKETVFPKVLEYYFSRTGDKLLFEQAKNPADSLSMRQVIYYDLRAGRPVTIAKGGSEFKNFAMSEDGSQVAYLAERDAKPKDLQKFYKLWYYRAGMDSAKIIAEKNSIGMKLGLTVSEHGNVSFSKSGKRLFFGTGAIQPAKDTSIIEIDMPKLDIWHYNDEYLQTVQNYPARLRAAQQENYLAVYDIENRSIKQLASREIPQLLQTNEGDGDIFVGVTDFGKRVESQWLGVTRKDIYAIDVKTGERKLVKENLHGQAYPSSTGKYIMWYDRKARHYFVWDGIETRNISAKIKVPLWNEEYDSPDDPGNYGVMRWIENDEGVLLYDRYDIWNVDPKAQKHPVALTEGRQSKTQFRYVQTDPEERFIKPDRSFLIRSLDEMDKSAGIGHWAPYKENGIVELDFKEKVLLGQVLAAKDNRDVLLITKETYNEPPNLYTNVGAIKDNIELLLSCKNKITSINPQQSNYLWGTAELFNWKAYNGKEATGIVYKPENFDPKKKYPVIVYFYEKLSDGLYDYKEPAPIRSAVNVPYFVSNGYIVFMPDIHYKIGYPGQSAYDYIVSGARALVKKGWADSTRMALQGHSWGGYQAAQLATMTKLFKAVWAGAPVANMTSAYGGIRWESGVNRQFQYEKTQSRIGATLWEKPELYIKNSPLFHLNKVTAPMVIMANDADGAVPWYQGIELFTGLRRLGKKVWMFNYNGQGHGLTQRQDMRDYQIRMQQFFDWILKGERPAKWITEGLPAVKKGKEWALEVE